MLEEWGVLKVKAHLKLSQGVLIFEIDISSPKEEITICLFCDHPKLE
jgi:hypothetical protein